MRVVTASLANLWIDPSRPRAVDAPMLADDPDVVAWLAVLDAHAGEPTTGDGRLGLHQRLHTQLVAGEPVEVVGEDPTDPGWVEVVAPWQSSRLDPRGYPGWVRRAHLGDEVVDGPALPAVPAPDAAGSARHPLVALAHLHLGLPYLWGGASPAGLDCSGLVHWAWRRLGRLVPRDADDQQDAAQPVDLDAVRPGDLYFFTKPGSSSAHHVGIVTGPGRMVHAPETGAGIVDEPLDPRRLATLSGAGRFVLPD